MSVWIKCDVYGCDSIERLCGAEPGSYSAGMLLPRGWAQVTVQVPQVPVQPGILGAANVLRAVGENTGNEAALQIAEFAEAHMDAMPPQLVPVSRVVCSRHAMPSFVPPRESSDGDA